MSEAGHTFPYVAVAGTAYEMGVQHGEQASSLIERYLRLIERLSSTTRDRLCGKARHATSLISALSPAFVEEIRGLAHGAKITFEEALLCQIRLQTIAADSSPLDGGCSAFSVQGEATADQQPLAGQNQDLPPEFADVGIVLHVHPDDGRPRAVMFTFAGQIGYAGMNEYGVSNFVNALYDFTWLPGLSHYPVRRRLLEQRNVMACIKILSTVRVCSAANYVLSDGAGACSDIEVRPDGVAVLPDDSAGVLVHTNHYVSHEFCRYESGSLPDSRPRMTRMLNLIHARWGRIDVDTMKDIMADHEGDPAAICRHGDHGMHSVAGYIADPARGLFHIRRGHGCLGTWESYPV